MTALIIAIDGPAASGKSTVARKLATALDLVYLDTGAMYRGLTLRVLEAEVDPGDEAACVKLAQATTIDFDDSGHVLVDGRPGEPAIRGALVTGAVSQVAAHPGVRAQVVPKQRAIALQPGRRGVVAEGRDTTTVVFPEASHKFFLAASAAERARRRALEQDEPESVAAIQAAIEERDRLDSSRLHSPLQEAPDAIRITTDGKSAGEVLAEILEHVSGARTEGHSPN